MDQDSESTSTTNTPAESPTASSASPAAKGEALLQEAAAEMAEEESSQSEKETSAKPPKKSRKKLWISLIAVVLIAGLAVVGWLLFSGDDSTKTTTNTPDTSAAEEQVAENTYAPNTIAYAYRSANADPFTIYTRPAIGGDRTEITKLERDEYASVSDTVGSTVVFGSDTKLYVSTDSGKTYKTLYEATSGEAINSVKVSFEGTKVAIAVVPDFSNQTSGKVITVDLDGKNKKDLFTDEKALYLIGWSEKKNQMAYWQGCYACDGGKSGWKLRDLKASTAKDLVTGVDTKEFYHRVAISSDMSQLIYVQATTDASIEVEGPPGYYSAAPYRVKVAELASGKSSLIATVGTKNEKNTNGTEKIRIVSVGFLAGTNTPYYADETKLYKVVDTKPSLLYQADQQIINVSFVNKDTVIASTGNPSTADFVLSSYDVAAKKSTQILQGDANTSLFGVTTK